VCENPRAGGFFHGRSLEGGILLVIWASQTGHPRLLFQVRHLRDYAVNFRLHPWVLQHNPLTGVAYPALNMQKTGVVFNKDSGEALDVDLDFTGVLHTHRPKLLSSMAKTTTILLNRQARATSFSHNFLLWTALFHELLVWGVVPTCWWTQATFADLRRLQVLEC
jgi:hypothetical protein